MDVDEVVWFAPPDRPVEGNTVHVRTRPDEPVGRTMRVFISGPRGEDGKNLPQFPDAARRLDAAGHVPELPGWYAELNSEDGSRRLLDDPLWMGDCYEAVKRCDAVALLDGWRDSPGAMFEVGCALGLGRQVLLLESWLDGSWDGWPERMNPVRRVIEEAAREAMNALDDRSGPVSRS